MAINPANLSILQYPAPILRDRAKPIPKITDEVRSVVHRMIELMQEAKGVGLAAPQVGLPWRVFVTDVPDEKSVKVYINPALRNFGNETDVCEEGCLSLPDVRVDVERPTLVTITAQDLEGQPITVTSNDFAARVWQHEFDHLNGVLIIDHLPPEERKAMRQALKSKAAYGA